MALSTFVKIGNITNLSDARYCAGMMVDVLGFNLAPDDHFHIDSETFNEITNWVSGVKLAGEFGQTSAREVLKLRSSYQLDYVESTNPDTAKELFMEGINVGVRMDIVSTEKIDKLASEIGKVTDFATWITIVCEDHLGGLVEDTLAGVDSRNLIKGFGLDTDTIETLPAFYKGIAMEGSAEDRPGYKDYGLVMDILEVLEEED